ncbi:MAG: galactokinase [Candidatus Sumerlaeota bacterium]|nr:galactokinase [Candidatus Sumerlaeota bacterium]
MSDLRISSTEAAAAIETSAPGRICLFGEHQDYLGLPVIAAGIDLRVSIVARPRAASPFRVAMPDIHKVVEFDPNKENTYSHDRDYLIAAANVLRREGVEWPCGYDVEVTSTIPINSGASSSSALQVAWCAFLLAAAGDVRAADPRTAARYAHLSEVVEFGSPGGMMDHYSTALGGIIWLDCATHTPAPLPAWASEYVLVDSGIPKDTNGVLGSVRARAESIDVDFHALNGAEEWPAIHDSLPPDRRGVFLANARNKQLTLEARGVIENTTDAVRLGRLLSEHHVQLSRNLGVSLPAIDDLLARGIAAGALGGKINGSGGGGSLFLFCPGRSNEIAALYQGMGLRAFAVAVSSGLGLLIDGKERVCS